MDTPQLVPSSARARLDRLPILSFHRRLMWVLGFVFFFELGDINAFSFAAPAILTYWHLPLSTIGFIVSATFIGMFVGSAGAGWLSDRVGRKPALVGTTLWYSAFSLSTAVAQTPTELFGARLLTGVGLSAMTVVGITYVSEMFPAAKRGAYQAWIMTIGLTGIPVTAYVARVCVPIAGWGWRLVFVWGALGLLLPFFARWLEESPQWHENAGRLSEAEAVVGRLEEMGRVETAGLGAIVESVETKPLARSDVALWSPRYRRRTAMLVITWVCQTLGFHGFNGWVPTLLVTHGFSLVQSLGWSFAISTGAVPGAAIAALLSDRVQRKWSIVVMSLLIAFCGLMYGLTFTMATIICFGFLVAMLQHTFAPLLYAYTAECYPTGIRNFGTGMAYGLGRIANIGGPIIIVFLFGRYGYSSVFIYIAATWLLAALTIAALGPTTMQTALE